MRLVVVILMSCFFIACSNSGRKQFSARIDNNNQFSILQGSTDSTSTIIRLTYPKFFDLKYTITDEKKNSVPVSHVKHYEKENNEFRVTHLFIDNLSPQKQYELSVQAQGVKWSDKRLFRTLPKNKEQLRILVASCMSDTYNEIGNEIWPKAFAHDPDIVFLTGDNLYADVYSGVYIGKQIEMTPIHLWNRHVDHAMKMKIYRMKKLTPTLVTWDDHDYGVNDGDKSYKFKHVSKNIFHIFFPTKENAWLSKGPGVGHSFRYMKTNFLFLDARSFRDSKTNKGGYHFGKKQREWITKQMKNDKLKMNWLISGDQFYGGYHKFESFEGLHPKEFLKFRKDLAKLGEKNLFLSGDRHLVEVMKIKDDVLGKETLEYTVSGVHTKMYSGSLDYSPNPRRVDGFDGKPNYAIFDIITEENDFLVNFKAYSLSGKEIDRKDKF